MNKELTAILLSSFDPLVILDNQLRILEYNQPMASTLNVLQTDLVGSSFSTIISIPGQSKNIMNGFLNQNFSNAKVLMGAGSDLSAQINLAQVEDKILCVVRIDKDLFDDNSFSSKTSIKVAHAKLEEGQNQLAHLEKLLALGKLTTGIAHELNNSINIFSLGSIGLEKEIKSFLKLLSIYSKIDEDEGSEVGKAARQLKNEIDFSAAAELVLSLVNDLKVGAKRSTEIVKGLRNFARQEQEVKHYANLHEGIDETLLLIKSKTGKVEIIKKYDPQIGKVLCFQGELNQVFLNLILNSLHAISGTQGKITIETKIIGEAIVIAVEDNGVGMVDAVKSHVFEPYFTTKPSGEGTGLGLSISHAIIDKHEGEIEIESEPGFGTKICITIPIGS